MESITLPKQVGAKVKRASKSLGVSEDAFTLNAVLFYLKNLQSKVDLKIELNEWNEASNADLLRFEKSL